MANFLINLNSVTGEPTTRHELTEKLGVGLRGECLLYGKQGTFNIVRNGEDAIADRSADFAKKAAERGIKVIIAGAGGAAHLAALVRRRYLRSTR